MNKKRATISFPLPAIQRLAFWIKCGLALTIYSECLTVGSVWADDYYFDPSLLETSRSGQQAVDLSAFSRKNAQLPGEYVVDIYINKKKTVQRKITFIAGDDHQLLPTFTIGRLRELGFKEDKYPQWAEQDDQKQVPDRAKDIDRKSVGKGKG